VNLCRLANSVFCAPPISWLLPAPMIWDRQDPLRFLRNRLRGGIQFLEGLVTFPPYLGPWGAHL